MSTDFYRSFEDKHRGSRELIAARLRAYLPFVEPLAAADKGAQTVDLGCGRGEWLELMTEVGFTPRGVDLDEGMLDGCLELGLLVEKGDALDFIARLPGESQAIVSAFHVVEHISFEQLQTVVSEALRVLKPGGLLIMETPNPENILVGACDFYLDPTHQRPIPPGLLAFLPEYCGFARTKTVRLQESKDLRQSASVRLEDVLGGVSPDYAVIAQKTAAADIFHRVDAAFEQEYGLPLSTLAARYDAQLETKVQQAEARAERAEAQAQQLGQAVNAIANGCSWCRTEAQAQLAARAEAQAQQAKAKAEHAEAQAQQAKAKAEHAEAQARQAEAKAERAEAQSQQAEARAERAEAQAHLAEAEAERAEVQAQQLRQALQAVVNSRSWVVTAPLRWLGLQARQLRDKGPTARLKALVKKSAKFVLRRCIRFVNQRAGLRRFLVSRARKIGAYSALRSIYIRLSNQEDALAAAEHEMHMRTWAGTAVTTSPSGTLTIDELLSRVRAELEATPTEGQQQ